MHKSLPRAATGSISPANSQITSATSTPELSFRQRQLLRLPAVMERTGLSKTAVYVTPDFPRPVKLTPMASAWVSSEVDAWIESRMAARDAKQR